MSWLLAPCGMWDVAADHTAFTLATSSWGELRLTTPLVGHHQAVNAALAVEALGHAAVELRPSAGALVEGVGGVIWPGRDQIEEIGGRTWLFDVAHNVVGVGSLVAVLDRLALPRPWVALFGVLGDREWKDMLPPVLQRVDRAILTHPPSAPPERCWDAAEAAESHGHSPPGELSAHHGTRLRSGPRPRPGWYGGRYRDSHGFVPHRGRRPEAARTLPVPGLVVGETPSFSPTGCTKPGEP